jgi:hypothetical protein
MLRTIAIVAAFALAATAADAQKLDKNGKCHAADGKFAKAEVCANLKPAAPAHCRDMKTKKFAKCDTPGTEPVPAKK